MGEHQAFASQITDHWFQRLEEVQVLKTGVTNSKATLRILPCFPGYGRLGAYFPFSLSILGRDMRTVFAKTLRRLWADIHPGVFRFPGGCIVEGTDLETRYDWKKSSGGR